MMMTTLTHRTVMSALYRHAPLAFILALCLLGLASPVDAGAVYRLTPYSGFTPTAVNNQGVVVGTGTPGGKSTAYYWSAAMGRVTIDTSSGYASWANDITDSGLVCGQKQWIAGYSGIPGATLFDIISNEYVPHQDSTMSHAYALTNSTNPGLGGTYTYTNYSGSIRYYVASYYLPNGAGGYALTRLSPGHRVTAMNSGGGAVGQIGSGLSDAFFYDGTTFYTLTGLAASKSEGAHDINQYGTIVGQGDNADNRSRAVLWNGNSAAVDLGVLTNTHPTPGSQESGAYEINHQGHIVGWSQLWIDSSNYRQQHGFIYHDDQMFDLNDLTEAGTSIITTAYAINDAGQIATERGLLTPHFVANSSFDGGDFSSWAKATPSGTVDVIADPDDALNYVLRLVTGSPVAVSQTIDTPDQMFTLAFDYRFDNAAGDLSLSIDSLALLPDIAAEDTTWHHAERLVTDTELWGLADVELLFHLGTTAAPATVYLDNITLTPSAVPEPATFGLLAICGLALLCRQRP